jgi:uncharacterized protein YggE
MRSRALAWSITLFACLILLVADGARAQTAAPADSTLSIVGTGVARPVPDRATLTAHVRSGAATAVAARSRVNTRVRAVLAGIESLGVPRSEVQTSSIGLSRITRRPLRRGGQPRVFFTASGSVVVRTGRISLVGAIVDAATRAGADDISGPSFSFSNPSSGKLEATRAAIDDARARAQDAAARLGMRISGTRSIVIDSSEVFNPQPVALSAPSSGRPAPSPPTPVRPGSQTTRISVSIVFLLAPA